MVTWIILGFPDPLDEPLQPAAGGFLITNLSIIQMFSVLCEIGGELFTVRYPVLFFGINIFRYSMTRVNPIDEYLKLNV